MIEVLWVLISMRRIAIDSMKEAKTLVEKVDEENTKNLIPKIVEAMLFLVPFVGAAIGGLIGAGAALARFLTVLDVGDNGGLGIYSIIKNAEVALVAILENGSRHHRSTECKGTYLCKAGQSEAGHDCRDEV